jgi:hypothetical protein
MLRDQTNRLLSKSLSEPVLTRGDPVITRLESTSVLPRANPPPNVAGVVPPIIGPGE